ncbi:MAG: helix-hairpin-helix domain-containing protein [bacterium]|nr:helix-hairpin-helix domain-containing protein [bacterium]
MKYLKGTWIVSDPGGHASMTGFEEVLDELVTKPGGGRVRRKGKLGKGITITPCMDDGDKNQVHEKTQERLYAGEFMVQDTPKNRQTLTDHLKIGFIEMNDYNLHWELLGEEPDEPEITEEEVIEEEVIETDANPKGSPAAQKQKKKEIAERLQKGLEVFRKENNEAMETLQALTSIKIRKEEVLAGIVEKGIKTMEQLAATNKDILLSVKFVGEKLATDMLEEAQKLSGGSKEE